MIFLVTPSSFRIDNDNPAGIGTVHLPVAGFHRALPSTSLDESSVIKLTALYYHSKIQLSIVRHGDVSLVPIGIKTLKSAHINSFAYIH